MKDAYALAYTLYQNDRYLEASHIFRLLTLAHPSEPKFWNGLGAALQMQRDYQEAIHCYLHCADLAAEKTTPMLYVQMADCYFALKQKDAGLKNLEIAQTKGKKENHTAVLQHVALMQQLWKKT